MEVYKQKINPVSLYATTSWPAAEPCSPPDCRPTHNSYTTRLSGCDVNFTGGEGGVRESVVEGKDLGQAPAYPVSFSSTDSWGP